MRNRRGVAAMLKADAVEMEDGGWDEEDCGWSFDIRCAGDTSSGDEGNGG